MNKIFSLLLFIVTTSLSAQNQIQFDKKFVQSEDKWVAFQADSTDTHNFGFIYIDPKAGLTFDYAGSFKIDANGKFIPKKKEFEGAAKYRLEPNNTLVAFIPESKFEELHIDKTPDWLKLYKEKEGSIEQLYDWGFMYNGWDECEKALSFLEKANKINPEYKGLQVELAYSYNCLKQYQKAIDVLKLALKVNPLDAYTNKELIFAEVKSDHVEEAKKVCRKVFKECKDKTYNGENAYNILQNYYLKKEIKNFNSWLVEVNPYLMEDQRFKPLVEKMKAELAQ